MSRLNILYRLWTGFRNHPFRFLARLGVSYAALWAFCEPILGFIDEPALRGASRYLVLVMASVAIAVGRTMIPKQARIHLKNTSCGIQIAFGDFLRACLKMHLEFSKTSQHEANHCQVDHGLAGQGLTFVIPTESAGT